MNHLIRRTSLFVAACIMASNSTPALAAQFRAGAAAVDVSPPSFPVIVNGGFLQAIGQKSLDRLHSRAIVLDDGTTKLVMAVVDSCMIPRDLLDKAKEIASRETGIPVDRMMISATHTHTAPSAMWALGTPPDQGYVDFLPAKIAESIVAAHAKLQPARIGWSSIEDYDHTHNRRWIRRADKLIQDPFGNATGRAHMHPGYQNPDAVGPSGPVDPGLSVVSVQTPAGKPIALMANYSMHYFGTGPVSADYFGKFVTSIAGKIGAAGDSEFVGIMSQGTSGDQHWMDYSKPKTDITIDRYADEVAAKAFEAYGKIEYRDDISLAMAETAQKFMRRVPDEARLKWAKELKSKMAGPVPANVPEVYACEAIALDEDPERELKLQAIRIGELGIAAIPNEVFALTGLKIKAMSPLPATFNIELANGAEGYIPPIEQHQLGGYTTWPARTAALEVAAETKITEAIVTLLEKVAGKPRRSMKAVFRPIDEAVLKLKPVGYWRFEETGGNQAVDDSGHGNHGSYTEDVARFLPGPQWEATPDTGSVNRAIHIAGGSVRLSHQNLNTRESTISCWFRSGVPSESMEKTSVLASQVDLIGIGGHGPDAGKITIESAHGKLTGKTSIAPNAWYHFVVVRSPKMTTIYLSGAEEAASPATSEISKSAASATVIGGSGETSNFEGKIDDVAIFDRALSADEIKTIFRKPVPFDGEQ
jgi:hypothetical protein